MTSTDPTSMMRRRLSPTRAERALDAIQLTHVLGILSGWRSQAAAASPKRKALIESWIKRMEPQIA